MKKNYLIMVFAGMLALSFAGCASVEMAAKANQLPVEINDETIVVDGGYLVEAIPAREREEAPVKGSQNQKPYVVIKAADTGDADEEVEEDDDEIVYEDVDETVDEDVNLDEAKYSLIVLAGRVEHGTAKGEDCWEADWTISSSADVEWYLYSDTNSGCQYLVTKITEYYFWFIPHTYAEYVYEFPDGTYAEGELTGEDVVYLTTRLSDWSRFPELERVDRFTHISFMNGGSTRRFNFGDDDYTFIVTREDA